MYIELFSRVPLRQVNQDSSRSHISTELRLGPPFQVIRPQKTFGLGSGTVQSPDSVLKRLSSLFARLSTPRAFWITSRSVLIMARVATCHSWVSFQLAMPCLTQFWREGLDYADANKWSILQYHRCRQSHVRLMIVLAYCQIESLWPKIHTALPLICRFGITSLHFRQW